MELMTPPTTDTSREAVRRSCNQSDLGHLSDQLLSDVCRALLAERDALRDQLAAARNEALEEVKRSMMGFAHEHADHWSEEFAQGAETQTIGLIGVVDALKYTTPAPSQGFTEVISGINQGAASICPDIKPEEDVTHADDYAVNRFSVVMKAKLGRKRSEGRHGWNDKQQCSQKFLSDLLRAHVEKGDPVDVANFAMMLQQRGEAILPAPREVTVQEAAVLLLDIWLKEGLEAMQKHLRDLALEETK